MDYSALEALFRQYGVPYEVRRTLIGPIVFDYRKEKIPAPLRQSAPGPSMPPPKSWAATRWRWAITSTTPSRPFT
ncbi:MAG: hypothetical protein ACLUIR_06405 [Faecalibacterium prausnitzii]